MGCLDRLFEVCVEAPEAPLEHVANGGGALTFCTFQRRGKHVCGCHTDFRRHAASSGMATPV